MNNGRVKITWSVITRFFAVDLDDRVIMESQCVIKAVLTQGIVLSLDTTDDWDLLVTVVKSNMSSLEFL